MIGGRMKLALNACLLALALGCAGPQTATPPDEHSPTSTALVRPAGPPHNVIIFVADGLRYGSVNPTDGPAFVELRSQGVDFANSHSIYPTVTTANASAIATGHYLGDTGNFANTIYPGEPWLASAGYSRTPFLENDLILADMNSRFGGNYLHEASLMATARRHGFNTAVVGKTGPALIQDLTGAATGGLVIDESTGVPGVGALDIPADLTQAIAAAHLAASAPPRNRPNRAQQDWFTSVTTDVLLPRLSAGGKPFVLLFWSPDPDTSQHNQNDSPDQLTPGINGPTSRAAIHNASDDLARIRAALVAPHLDATTDVIVIADHGFTTVSKQSQNSYAASLHYRDSPAGELPPGFLAIDLAHALNIPLFNGNGLDVALDQGIFPSNGNALLGPDFEHPHIVVTANGGSDLIYLPAEDRAALAPRIVDFLTKQDYVSAIFAADSLGELPGALKLSDINLNGAALTPQPSIVVSLRSHSEGCDTELCAVEIADGSQKQGQGQHGSLSRAETRNFMAAVGPDFRAGFVDQSPISNADIAPTVAHILGFELPSNGNLRGRVIGEALRWGHPVQSSDETVRSTPAANGFVTMLNRQNVGETRYFDAAGASGRAVGLHD